MAAVEASLARSRLLLENVTDVAAMALDASDSIGATNSLEKMMAHQLAAVHKVAMDQLGHARYREDVAAQAKHINAAARCKRSYQQGLLTLHKIRQNGQRIVVQYVNVGDGGKAVIGNIEGIHGSQPWALVLINQSKYFLHLPSIDHHVPGAKCDTPDQAYGYLSQLTR